MTKQNTLKINNGIICLSYYTIGNNMLLFGYDRYMFKGSIIVLKVLDRDVEL